MLKPLHDPAEGPLRVAGLMSGSGTNLRRILEHRQALCAKPGGCPFEVVVIFSDNADSQATAIGRDFDIPVVTHDIRGFYKKRGLPRRDLNARAEFDEINVAALKSFNAEVAAYAGYMSIATPALINAFLGVNVHPGDLSVIQDGQRRWVGDHAVRDAIVAGEKTLRATTHLVELKVDGGHLLMLSDPLPVELRPNVDVSIPEAATCAESHNQERLKEAGDWVIFPKTLELIAAGRVSRDAEGRAYIDSRPAPLTPEELED